MSATETRPPSSATPTATYRAAVVKSFTEPLVVEQVPRLALEPGQVRVQVEAAGLCHTDIHAAHGDWPVKPSPPFVPGHEGVGLVEKLGDGVTHLSVGRRPAHLVASAAPPHCRHGIPRIAHDPTLPRPGNPAAGLSTGP